VHRAAADLGPDANDGSAGSERLAEELEHGCPALEQLQQAVARFELGPARLAQQAGRAADVEAGRLLGRKVEKRRPQHVEKPLFAWAEALVGEAAPQAARAETEPDDALVQILVGPRREPGIDGILELEDPLCDAAARRDHDDHHHAWLQHEHLDVPDRRCIQRRRGDERQQTSRLRQRFGRRLERRVELVPHLQQIDRERSRSSLDGVDELLRVHAVPGLRGNPACGRMGMRQQPERLQLGELVPRRRRGDPDAEAFHEHLRADRLSARDVFLDDPAQDLALPGRELHGSMVAPAEGASRPARPGGCVAHGPVTSSAAAHAGGLSTGRRAALP
jgi:hypothetical protein